MQNRRRAKRRLVASQRVVRATDITTAALRRSYDDDRLLLPSLLADFTNDTLSRALFSFLLVVRKLSALLTDVRANDVPDNSYPTVCSRRHYFRVVSLLFSVLRERYENKNIFCLVV